MSFLGVLGMRKIKLRDHIYQYEFMESADSPSYVVNITVITEGNKALIIDTAYSEHAKELREELNREGIIPEYVVLSHFHPDHVGGCAEFKDCTFIGSKYYKGNLEKCTADMPHLQAIAPSILVDNNYIMQFGSHSIVFIHTPGHSKCSITTLIDNDVLHVGDLIMKTKYGKTILPSISEDGSFDEHILSIEKVLNLKHNIMAFSHGDYASGQANVKMQAEDRLFYLKKVRESRGRLGIEEYLKNHITRYDALKIHEKNLDMLQNV